MTLTNSLFIGPHSVSADFKTGLPVFRNEDIVISLYGQLECLTRSNYLRTIFFFEYHYERMATAAQPAEILGYN